MADFASNAAYVGPLPNPSEEYADQPTKVAMTAAQRANGFVPQQPVAAEHLNHELNRLDGADTELQDSITEIEGDIAALQARTAADVPYTPAAPAAWSDPDPDSVTAALDTLVKRIERSDARAQEHALLRVHELDVTMDDTGASLGAISTGFLGDPSKPVLVVKVDSTGVVLAYDDAVIDRGAPLASITSLVADCASNGNRHVAIGVGGQRNAYTDNDGGSWSPGGNGVAGAVQFIIYDGAVGQFVCGGSGTGSIYRSPDASTNWTSAASLFGASFGLAALGIGASFGHLVCLGNSGPAPRFSVSTDGGASFSTAGTTPPANAADADEPGDLRGCQIGLLPVGAPIGANVYHIMRCNTGARIRTNKSTTGLTWTAATTITAPVGTTFISRPKLMIDQDQARPLFVIVAPLNNGAVAVYASVDFVSWTGPASFKTLPTAGWALAGGRLFCTRAGKVYASDSARY